MNEFADIFAYDLSTVVFMIGSTIMLTVFALAADWINRQPANTPAFELAPAYGL